MATIVVRPPRPRNAGERVSSTALTHQRVVMLLMLFVAMTMLVGGKLVWMGIESRLNHGGGTNSGLVSARADIVDRNGVPLARTMNAYSVAVRPSKLINDPSELSRKLAEIFPDESATSFYRKLTGKGWSYLRRRALPEEVEIGRAHV